MSNVIKVYNLSDPNQAREFLDHLYFNGNKVTYCETKESGRVYFDKCSDSQAVDFANQLSVLVPEVKE